MPCVESERRNSHIGKGVVQLGFTKVMNQRFSRDPPVE